MTPVTEEIFQKEFATIIGVDPQEVTPDRTLRGLVSDSFVLVEAVIELQEEFDILLHREELQDLSTVGELWTLISSKFTQ